MKYEFSDFGLELLMIN